MPITQARMIALINAANDYRIAFDRLRESVATDAARGLTPDAPDAQRSEALIAIATTASMDVTMFLDQTALTIATLAREMTHFRRHARRNEYEAERHRRRRNQTRTRAIDDFDFLPASPAALGNDEPLDARSRCSTCHELAVIRMPDGSTICTSCHAASDAPRSA